MSRLESKAMQQAVCDMNNSGENIQVLYKSVTVTAEC